MICGFLHPTFERWLKAIDDREPAVRRTMRAVLGGVAVAAGLAWYSTIYTLPKFEYNKLHPYTSWIPITAFLILRNITPSLRLKSLGLYGWLGCITLETYVLYVRMNIRPLLVRTHARTHALAHSPSRRRRRPAGNSTRGFCPRCPTPRYVPEPASMLYLFTDTHVPNHQTTDSQPQPIYLLSLLPEYPLINFTVVTALYIFLAFRLFKSTAWLRDAVIPHDDDALLRRNLLTMILGAGCAWLVGFAVQVLAQSI
jgi:hypothetical protein